MSMESYVETAEDHSVRPLPVTGDRHEACTPADAERLDPIVGGAPTEDELEVRQLAARELCAHCPVARLCAAMGDQILGDGHPAQGVWGGSLRYLVGGAHGTYVVVPLVPEAVPSVHDREAVEARLARKRAAVVAVGEGR